MSSSTGASNPRSPDHGGSPVQLAARAALERLRRQAARFSTASSSLTHENTRKSGSQRARCWREHDAEGHRYSFGNGIAELPDSRIRGRRRRMGVRFALDSLLEGDGFEPSVPRQKDNAFRDSSFPTCACATAAFQNARRPVQQLLLPVVNPVRMNAELTRQLGDRPVPRPPPSPPLRFNQPRCASSVSASSPDINAGSPGSQKAANAEPRQPWRHSARIDPDRGSRVRNGLAAGVAGGRRFEPSIPHLR